ncbi:MAG: gluconate:H+ symporter [Cyclobacteriaceae bacterium]
MSITYIAVIVILGVALLLVAVLKYKLNAFIALLIVSIFVGILAGMPLQGILTSIQKGMGNTLGFVAVVVGLGAIFGQMLESSGGANALAENLLTWFGKSRASWALVITGFIVAIPVFLDVGLIILVPMVYALARESGKSLLFYGIPLLAGLAVTHAFIPPTPGPIAVADILGADLGWVIFFGITLGLPTAVIAGPIFGTYIANRIHISAPNDLVSETSVSSSSDQPSFRLVAFIIATPLILILSGTLTAVLTERSLIASSKFTEVASFLGHPFSALIIATLMSIYFLCSKRGIPKEQILELSTKALGPAGIIILVTGAGGVLKQVLIDSGIGQIIADVIADAAMPAILLAWILAGAVRVTQGSATVAMITAAGIMAPILPVLNLSAPHIALVVIAIASGGTILSHVNDSGFWLVSRYFGMNEKQTLQSWTVMETLVGVCGLVFALIASLLI